MMKKIMEAVQRLQKRFDFSGHKRAEEKAVRAQKGKRPPKRKRRR